MDLITSVFTAPMPKYTSVLNLALKFVKKGLIICLATSLQAWPLSDLAINISYQIVCCTVT
eukprot:1137102-Pelagomonas_calceolata.AAC.2